MTPTVTTCFKLCKKKKIHLFNFSYQFLTIWIVNISKLTNTNNWKNINPIWFFACFSLWHSAHCPVPTGFAMGLTNYLDKYMVYISQVLGVLNNGYLVNCLYLHGRSLTPLFHVILFLQNYSFHRNTVR